MTLGKKKLPEELNVCMNYEMNLLDHVVAVALYRPTARCARIGRCNTRLFGAVAESGGVRRGQQYPFRF